tara:strand:+ start:3833 stop:5125 length:1293 start_codon:yes stop_codon:yes gene_type:complete
MNFRDFNKEYPAPYHNGKKWVYDDTPIYKSIEDCFHQTQRPVGIIKDGQTRCRDPFRKINKHMIQWWLGHHKDCKPTHHDKLDWISDDNDIVKAVINYQDCSHFKSGKRITSFTGKKFILSNNDSYIRDIACYPGYENWLKELIKKHESKSFIEGNTYIEIDMQCKSMRDILEELGYERVDNIISSFADMYGIWIKPGTCVEKINEYNEISLQRLDLEKQDTKPLLSQIRNEIKDWDVHYSKYNNSKSWTAVSLKGFGGKEEFIIKPSEMNGTWKKNNTDKMDWKVSDTPLRKKLSNVEHFIKLLPFDTERIRLMRLGKGEGELERHTDRQDKELGLEDGQIARLHFPLVTNEKVIFRQWNTDGTHTKIHMGEGELWYLDIRKPHTAINGGEENRIHLVIDIRCDEHFRNWLVDSSKKYPQPKEVDDYDE